MTTILRALPVIAALILQACSDANPSRNIAPSAPLPERMAAADARRGGRLFNACAACHNDAAGAHDRDGPNLWTVIGAPIGGVSPTYGYTAALRSIGGAWTCAKLDRWLTDPQRFAPGTLMTYPGLKDGLDRADVIAFLATRNADGGRGPPCPNGSPP